MNRVALISLLKISERVVVKWLAHRTTYTKIPGSVPVLGRKFHRLPFSALS